MAALRRLAGDDALAERLRAGARRWAVENYDARKNAARLQACFEQVVKADRDRARAGRAAGKGSEP